MPKTKRFEWNHCDGKVNVLKDERADVGGNHRVTNKTLKPVLQRKLRQRMARMQRLPINAILTCHLASLGHYHLSGHFQVLISPVGWGVVHQLSDALLFPCICLKVAPTKIFVLGSMVHVNSYQGIATVEEFKRNDRVNAGITRPNLRTSVNQARVIVYVRSTSKRGKEFEADRDHCVQQPFCNSIHHNIMPVIWRIV